MFLLPVEIQYQIYQYDDTYKIIFEDVKRQILDYGCYSRRIQRELIYLSSTYSFMKVISAPHFRRLNIKVYEKLFTVHIPFQYPHTPPIVYDCHGKQLWQVVDWSPICTVGSLVLTYYCIPTYECF